MAAVLGGFSLFYAKAVVGALLLVFIRYACLDWVVKQCLYIKD